MSYSVQRYNKAKAGSDGSFPCPRDDNDFSAQQMTGSQQHSELAHTKAPGERGVRIFKALRCAVPGCTSPKKNPFLPDDNERLFLDMEEEKDRQAAVDRAIDHVVAHEQTIEILHPSSSMESDATEDQTRPIWEIQPSYDDEIKVFSATWESDVAKPMEEMKREMENPRENATISVDVPVPEEVIGRHKVFTENGSESDDDSSGITPPAEVLQTSEKDLDRILNTHDSDSQAHANKSMNDIMSSAKERRTRLEAAAQKQAEEVRGASDVPDQDVQQLMKRIDRLAAFLHDNEIQESVTMKPSFSSEYISGGLTPRIEPSQSSQSPSPTPHPFFWRSHPGGSKPKTTSISPSSVIPPQERHEVIENLPVLGSSSPLIAPSSVLVLTPRRSGRLTTQRPPLSPATRAGNSKARFDESFSIVNRNSILDFPEIPTNATSYTSDDEMLNWTSDDSHDWSSFGRAWTDVPTIADASF
jgi:hypothetical protein